MAYGVRLGVRVTDPASMDVVMNALPPGSSPADDPEVDHLLSWVGPGPAGPVGGGRPSHLLYRGTDLLARSDDPAVVDEAMETELRRIVAEHAPELVFVHAGVVGWHGRAILLPGRSFTGKTTLVAELLRSGATYYSDEYAVLDRRGRAQPFAKSLSVRHGPGRGADVPPSAFGASIGRGAIPVAAIVITSYLAGSTFRPGRRSEGEGVLSLLDNAVSARSHPRRVLVALAAASRGAIVVEGQRGEAGIAASAILTEVGWPPGQAHILSRGPDRAVMAGPR